eukprot:jgi/Psemu1/30962/gm1.30962_g
MEQRSNNEAQVSDNNDGNFSVTISGCINEVQVSFCYLQEDWNPQTQDFNKTGRFQAYWKNIFKIAKTYKTDYGTCPNKACFDKHWYKKWNQAINDPKNPLDPFNKLEHFVWCAMENIMTKWATHRCLEPNSIVKEGFEIGVFSEGEFGGIEYIHLKPNYNGQKKQSLPLNNPVLDNCSTKKTTLPCPYNGDPIGYEKPERCTAHGKRHKSISKAVNAGVSALLVKGLGASFKRKLTLNTTTNYTILPDQQAVDAAVQAKHGSPSKNRALAPAPTLAPVPTLAPALLSPALSTEESQAPALFLDESPMVSIQHSFSDHSNESVPSDSTAGTLGLTTQRFEPSSVPMSFTDQRRDYHNEAAPRSKPRSKPHYKNDCSKFAEEYPQYEDYPCKPQYNRPREPGYNHLWDLRTPI